jgi:fibronectin-binding autotransporter adhesin
MGNASSGGLAYVTAAGGGGAGAAITIGGNTAGVGAIISSGTLVLQGGNNITLSQNGQSLSIVGGAGGAGFSAGVSGGNTSGSTGLTGSQLVLAGGNNITLSQSTGANGASVTVQGAVGTGTSISGNFSATVNSAGLAFNASNLAGTATAKTGNASITLNSAGLSFNGSGLAGTATAITGNASITLNSAGLSFNGSGLAGTNTAVTGPVSVTLNSSGISLNVPATSSISATGGLSVSVNGSTISIGQGPISRSIFPEAQFEPIGPPGMGSMSIQYFACDGALSASRLDALVGWAGASAATTATMAIAMSVWAAVYTRNASTLSSLSSGSTQTTYSYASNTAGATAFTNSQIRPVSVPINMNFSQGEYFVGFNFSTAASSIGASTTNLGQTLSMYGGSQIQSAINYAEISAATATSTNLYGGMGMLSAATGAIPVSIGLANINQTGTALTAANIAFVFRNV